MSGGCDRERSDEERALDRLRAEVRRLTAEVERLSRSEAACVREALEQVGVARAERDEARAEIARLNAELAKLRALKSAECCNWHRSGGLASVPCCATTSDDGGWNDGAAMHMAALLGKAEQ